MRWVNVRTLFFSNKCRGNKLHIVHVDSFEDFCGWLQLHGAGVFFYCSNIGDLYAKFSPDLVYVRSYELDYRARGMSDMKVPMFCATDLLRNKKKLKRFYYDCDINPCDIIMYFSKE